MNYQNLNNTLQNSAGMTHSPQTEPKTSFTKTPAQFTNLLTKPITIYHISADNQNSKNQSSLKHNTPTIKQQYTFYKHQHRQPAQNT